MMGSIYANQIQEKDNIETNSRYGSFHINTFLEIAKISILNDVAPLKINMNVTYAEPTEITIQPIIKLGNGTSYKINSISKTIVGINQTLSHQFSIPLKYLGENIITLLITNSKNPSDVIEIDTMFDRIKVIKQ